MPQPTVFEKQLAQDKQDLDSLETLLTKTADKIRNDENEMKLAKRNEKIKKFAKIGTFVAIAGATLFGYFQLRDVEAKDLKPQTAIYVSDTNSLNVLAGTYQRQIDSLKTLDLVAQQELKTLHTQNRSLSSRKSLLQTQTNVIDCIMTGKTINSPMRLPKGEYIVRNNIVITKTGQLTLEPGVRLYMHQGNYISAKGPIIAVGTEEEPILFSGNATKTWQGIKMTTGNSSSANKFTYCIFEDMHSSGTGSNGSPIALYSSIVEINSCTFKENLAQDAIINSEYSTITIRDTEFIRNVVTQYGAIRASKNNTTYISNNLDLLAKFI